VWGSVDVYSEDHTTNINGVSHHADILNAEPSGIKVVNRL
jgi:hypothetical protein